MSNRWSIHRFILFAFVILSVFFMGIGTGHAEISDEFVAADKQRIAEVELFEFHDPLLQKKAISLARSLRCPQCQNQNLVESNSPLAQDLKLIVFKMINEGKNEQQVVDYMTDRYGEFVLYKPKFSPETALLWGLPLLCAVLFFLLSWLRIRRLNP